MQWEIVIGLEIHAQLTTASKIFSGSATAFGAEANTQASLIDLGMPGTLPVLNAQAVRKAVKFGLAPAAIVTAIVSPIAREIAKIYEATMPESAAGKATRVVTSSLFAPTP